MVDDISLQHLSFMVRHRSVVLRAFSGEWTVMEGGGKVQIGDWLRSPLSLCFVELEKTVANTCSKREFH